MEFNNIVSTAIDRYIVKLSQVGYYNDRDTLKLVILAILEELSELFSEEDIKNCKMGIIIECLTNTCLTSGLNNECPDIYNFTNILASN